MQIVMLSIDSNILKEGSKEQYRMKEYGTLFAELHIIVYTKPGFTQKKLSPNVTVYPTNTRFKPLYFLAAYRLGSSIIKKLRLAEVIITSQEAFTNFVGIWLKKRFGVRLQVQIHTDFLSPHFVSESLINQARVEGYMAGLRQADCIRVVSLRIKNSLLSLKPPLLCEPFVLPLLPDEKALPSGNVPTKKLHDAYPKWSFIMLMVSRLTEEKDYPTAFSVLKKMLEIHPRVGLVICGAGPLEKKLKRLSFDMGLTEHIAFVGWTEELGDYYKTADMFLLTSRYEGYGLVLLEAACAGVPIVTTDVGLVGEVFLHGANALVCPVGDADCLAEHAATLLRKNDLRRRLGLSAQTYAQKILTQTEEEYLQKYKQSFEVCMMPDQSPTIIPPQS